MRKRTATSQLIRSINRTAVLDLMRTESPIARSRIARKLNTSIPTVMRIVDSLMEEGLVKSLDRVESSGGRPRPLLAFDGEANVAVGIDLGGSKMFGAVADLAGNVIHERYVPWKDGDSEDRLEELCHLIEELLAAPRPPEKKIRGIGVGAPGATISPTGIVTWAPSLGWRDFPLKDILSERFDVPVFVDNDVNLSALGEYGFGAGRGCSSLVCIAVGTGIGAGIVLDGVPYRGHNFSAGEIGYLLPGIKYLGHRYDQFGALESLASGTGVAKRARQLFEEQSKPPPVSPLGAEAVFDAARQGEDWAQQVVDETVDYLSLAIATVGSLLDPEIIVLGGGVARSADLLIEPIMERLDGAIPVLPQLVPSELGRRAAAMGAIMYVMYGTTEHVIVNQLI